MRTCYQNVVKSLECYPQPPSRCTYDNIFRKLDLDLHIEVEVTKRSTFYGWGITSKKQLQGSDKWTYKLELKQCCEVKKKTYMKFTLYLDSFCEFGQICRHSKLTHSKFLKDKDKMQPENPAGNDEGFILLFKNQEVKCFHVGCNLNVTELRAAQTSQTPVEVTFVTDLGFSSGFGNILYLLRRDRIWLKSALNLCFAFLFFFTSVISNWCFFFKKLLSLCRCDRCDLKVRCTLCLNKKYNKIHWKKKIIIWLWQRCISQLIQRFWLECH